MVAEISDQIAQYLDDYTSVSHQINQINLDAADLGLLNLDDFEEMGRYFWHQLQVFDVATSILGVSSRRLLVSNG
ncbi:MAG: hypothetical protein AAGE59_14790 [Cyanobacteria bacterium P01_F01_bin.86]